MDLADIRKKARVQGAQQEPDNRPQELVPAAIVAQEPAPEAGQERFWEEIGCEQFATEEEYAQGLSGQEVEEDAAQVQWLGFYLGSEEYALDLEIVSELIKPRALTELPQVPEYVCGIISLRGEVIPVIDLKQRLGLKTANQCDLELQRIVVCEGAEQRIGLLVDRISQVVRLPQADIETPQLVGGEPAAAFIQGVGRKQNRMLIQLRPEKALEIDASLA